MTLTFMPTLIQLLQQNSITYHNRQPDARFVLMHSYCYFILVMFFALAILWLIVRCAQVHRTKKDVQRDHK